MLLCLYIKLNSYVYPYYALGIFFNSPANYEINREIILIKLRRQTLNAGC